MRLAVDSRASVVAPMHEATSTGGEKQYSSSWGQAAATRQMDIGGTIRSLSLACCINFEMARVCGLVLEGVLFLSLLSPMLNLLQIPMSVQLCGGGLPVTSGTRTKIHEVRNPSRHLGQHIYSVNSPTASKCAILTRV
jgi:hypothetical protein